MTCTTHTYARQLRGGAVLHGTSPDVGVELQGMAFPAVTPQEFTFALVAAAGSCPDTADSWGTGGFLGLAGPGASPIRVGLMGSRLSNTAGWAGMGSPSGFTGELDPTPALYVFVRSGGLLIVRKNGLQVASVALSPAIVTTFDRLAAETNVEGGLVGEVSEVRLYDAAFNTAQLLELEAELMVKWGLPGTAAGACAISLPSGEWAVSTQKNTGRNRWPFIGYSREEFSGAPLSLVKSGELLEGTGVLIYSGEEVDQGLVPSKILFAAIEDPAGLYSTGAWNICWKLGTTKELCATATRIPAGQTGGAVFPSPHPVMYASRNDSLGLNASSRKGWVLHTRIIPAI